jgi:plastin-1
MVNDAVPNTIDQKAINSKKPLNLIESKENLLLGLSSAKSIGCKVEDVTPLDVAKGKKNPILKLLSEIFKVKIIYNFDFYNVKLKSRT